MLSFLVYTCFIGICLCQGPPSEPDSPDDDEEYCLVFDSPVYVCSDPLSRGFIDTSGLEAQRHNETLSYMSGNFKFIKGMHEDTMVEIILDKEHSGRFDKVLTHEICRLCDEVGNPDSNYNAYLTFMPDACPFDKGTYNVDFLAVDTLGLPINSSNRGRYQITMNFYNNPEGNCKNEKTFEACLKMTFLIEPC